MSESNPMGSDCPARGWRIAFLVACTVGICLSADLLRLHVNVHTDPNYQSYCAISERVNCDTLALSPYALFAGMPLSIWGLFGYLGMAGLSIWGLGRPTRSRSWPFGLLFLLSALSAGVAIPLFAIAHFVVESVCIVCAGTYVVSFLLLVFSWQTLRRIGLSPWAAIREDMQVIGKIPGRFGTFTGAFALPLVAIWIALPPYWQVKNVQLSEGVATGVTDDGAPWIGGTSSSLTITEFSDYQCPHCQRGHHELRELIEAYPDKVRLVHRNNPLDHHCNPTLNREFHAEACRYARMAVCAKKQSAFWQANDYLFAEGRNRDPITTKQLAKSIGIDRNLLDTCISSKEAKREVAEDLRIGRELGVRGTPTFVIGKQVFPGRVPPDLLVEQLGLAR